MNDWINQILLSKIYENKNNIIYKQNYIINDPLMFLIIRRIKYHPNENDKTSDVFNFYVDSTSYDEDVALGEEAYTDSITLENKNVVSYTPEASLKAINNLGGFYIPYSKDKATALKYDYLKDEELMKPGWVNAIFIFIYINRNNELVVLNKLDFERYATGEIYGMYTADSFPNFYSSSLDYFRAFLELIFLILVSIYIYKSIKKILVYHLIVKYKEMLDSQDRSLRYSNMIFRLLERDISSSSDRSFAQEAWEYAFYIVRFLMKFTLLLLLSIYEYITKSIYNIMRVGSLIWTLWLISKWILIITEREYEVDELGRTQENTIFSSVWSIKNNYDTYVLLWWINFLFLFISLTKYFIFSSSLSLFCEVIKRSSHDLGFFIIMYLNMIFVLALIMNIIFGITDENFETILYSIMSSFLISIGRASSLKIKTFNTPLRDFFNGIFAIATLLLFNMFAAIITSHYFEFYLEQNDSKVSSVKMFMDAILKNSESYQDKTNDSWITKSKNFLLRYVFKWVYDATHTEAVKTFDNMKGSKIWAKNLKSVQKSIILNAPNRILKFIREDHSDYIGLEDRDFETNSVNTHFWVSNIDYYLLKMSKLIFKNLCKSSHKILELEQDRRVKIDENDGEFSEADSNNRKNKDIFCKWHSFNFKSYEFAQICCVIRRYSQFCCSINV